MTRIFTREVEINHQTPVTSLLSRVVTSLCQRAVLLCQPIWFRTITCTLWLYVLFMHCISKMISTAINDEFKGYRTPSRPHLSRDILIIIILKLRLAALRLVHLWRPHSCFVVTFLATHGFSITYIFIHTDPHIYTDTEGNASIYSLGKPSSSWVSESGLLARYVCC